MGALLPDHTPSKPIDKSTDPKRRAWRHDQWSKGTIQCSNGTHARGNFKRHTCEMKFQKAHMRDEMIIKIEMSFSRIDNWLFSNNPCDVLIHPLKKPRKKRKESLRKSRNRPAFKQKKRESGKKRQTINRALGKSRDGVKKYRSDESKQKKREADRKRQAINRALGKSRDCANKYRSDPVKYEHEMALQRERRARKRQNTQDSSDSNQKNCQAINHAAGKSGDCVKKYRSDPVKYEHQMALQRERRARKKHPDRV
ncbi:hypothetical protein TNCV_2921911 [Trichonephila clavipes]|nr:hypothetical protein TNCV_2921911 [Trichonephila clavipes]